MNGGARLRRALISERQKIRARRSLAPPWFMEREHLQNSDVNRSHEPLGIPLNRPSGTFSPIGGEGRDEEAGFMGRAARGMNRRMCEVDLSLAGIYACGGWITDCDLATGAAGSGAGAGLAAMADGARRISISLNGAGWETTTCFNRINSSNARKVTTTSERLVVCSNNSENFNAGLSAIVRPSNSIFSLTVHLSSKMSRAPSRC